MTQSIGLADFIDQVKRELMKSDVDGVDLPRLLMVEEVQIDIQIGVSYSANAGLNVQVVQIGGGGKHDDTHTVHVRLQPVLSHEQRLAELQKDPRWPEWSKAIVNHTVKSAGSSSQRED
jgi:hypothetical protein